MSLSTVGEGLGPPEFKNRLKPCGEIVKEQLGLIEKRFPTVSVEDYVIMPGHIQAIIYFHNDTEAGGASPSPTLNDVVCAFKSLVSKICKQRSGIEKLFQRSFYDHVIRNREDYEEHVKYIYENPMRWYYKVEGLFQRALLSSLKRFSTFFKKGRFLLDKCVFLW